MTGVFTKMLRGASNRPLIFGMVHLQALPSSPLCKFSFDDTVRMACEEAQLLLNAGLDGVVVENMHDVPYVRARDTGPQVVACMTKVCAEVRRTAPRRAWFGVQVLAGCNQEALAVALAAGFDFIRAEGFVFAHVADEGLMDACAGSLLRYRKQLGADHIAVLTDIKKKHSSHAITQDIDVHETAKAAEFFRSDGVVLTGMSTGKPPSRGDLESVKGAVRIPVIVGSGVSLANFEQYWSADAWIIGSYFKCKGLWSEPIDAANVRKLVIAVKRHADLKEKEASREDGL